MARMMHWQVSVPSARRPSPRFGLGSFYRQVTQTRNPLGNLFRSIPLSFYRSAPGPAPFPVGTDLIGGGCPAVSAGKSCPIAPPAAPGNGRGLGTCAAHASGRGCPLAGMGRLRLPRFGMSGLGAANHYLDPSGYMVDASGNITDTYGNIIWSPASGGVGNFGPFQTDSSGSVLQGSTIIYDGPNDQLVATGAPGSGPASDLSRVTVVKTVAPGGAASTASFLAPPTGYAGAQPVVQPLSWWNQSTTLFGTVIKNSTLALGGGIAAAAALMLGSKKRR
jgi:hypothetical protein